jgi:hypothetical protein
LCLQRKSYPLAARSGCLGSMLKAGKFPSNLIVMYELKHYYVIANLQENLARKKISSGTIDPKSS